MRAPLLSVLILAALTADTAAQEAGRRPTTTDDGLNMVQVSDPLLSPDGRWVLFRRSELDWKENERKNTYYMAPAGGGEAFQYIGEAGGSAPQFSPDGSRIAFQSYRSGNPEIWVCDSEGKNARQLTFLDHPHTGAGSWSPDGTQIAFMSSKEGSFDIYTIGSAGGFPTRLTEETSADANPSWSRDGHWIYFVSDRTGRTEVWKIPAEGGRARQVTRNGGTEMFESPDGKFLFFNKQGVKGGLPGIWRMPVEGGEEVQMLEKVRFSEWTVSKNDIYYINRTAGPGEAIEMFDLLTGEVKRMALLQHSPNSWGISVSPDSRWIIYSVVESDESDLILVENFR